jgi:hypothetical protein
MSITAAQKAALNRADPNSIADALRDIEIGTKIDAYETAVGEVQAGTEVAALDPDDLTGTAVGALVDVAAAAGACAGGASPSATNVDTAIATAVAALETSTNLALLELATKVEEIRAALVTAGVLATPE